MKVWTNYQIIGIKNMENKKDTTRDCDHTYLGLIKEDNNQWVLKMKEDEKLCNECSTLIDKVFFRCNTCSFGYVCCSMCYGKGISSFKAKRVVKAKHFD